ncbi:MAG: hypothetical protein LWX83_03780 [Anaerolineae bacterium]|nr:hypothetical protein [Anaerolineae bacterium]
MTTYIYLSKQLLHDYITMKRPQDAPPLYFAYNQNTEAWIVSFGMPVDGTRDWVGIHIAYATGAEVDGVLNKLMDEIRQELDQHKLNYRIIP